MKSFQSIENIHVLNYFEIFLSITQVFVKYFTYLLIPLHFVDPRQHRSPDPLFDPLCTFSILFTISLVSPKRNYGKLQVLKTCMSLKYFKVFFVFPVILSILFICESYRDLIGQGNFHSWIYQGNYYYLQKALGKHMMTSQA